MGLGHRADVRLSGVAAEPIAAVNAAVELAAAAHRAALLAGVRAAAAAEALRGVDAEIAVTRRPLRAIDKRWLPWLHAALRTLDLSLGQAEQEDGARVRRAVAGSSERRTLP